MRAEETPFPRRRGCAACQTDIHIDNQGDVNVYNCTSPAPSSAPCPPADDDHVCPPVAPGACVPMALGAKPKQSRRHKLERLLANVPVPSTLGASFFHLASRHLAGATAANPIEEAAFATFARLSPELRRVLACARDSFDSLTSGERERLFAPELVLDAGQPLDPARLSAAFAKELTAHVAIQVFGDESSATEERAGKLRTPPYPGGEFPPAPVVVCRIDGLRTGTYRPPLAPGDYTPEEFQQTCHVVLDGTVPRQVCEVQTTNCPGHQSGGACLRVQDVEAGQTVLVEGMNFSSTDTKVRLTDAATFTQEWEVETYVWGDADTPLTELVNGEESIIADCRVHDRLTFQVPDLVPGLYAFRVLVPNEGGDPAWGDVLASEAERLTVVVPETARFQIASESLGCRVETSPEWPGSDEAGIGILAVPLFPDFTGGEPQRPNGGNPIRYSDADTGELFPMDHVLFSHQQPIAGLALSIAGFEIDSEEMFKRQVMDFGDAFLEILEQQLDYLKDHVDEAKSIAKLGWYGAFVAVAVLVAIDACYALWAPADPIIEDAIGPSTAELVRLTSESYPMPGPREHSTPSGIRVKVTPLEKVPHQYRERREYVSEDEGSRYEIVLRYTRLM